MTFIETLSTYGRVFRRWIYPESCPLCSRSLASWEINLCHSCGESLEELKPPLCLLCSRSLPPFGKAKVCRECSWEKHSIERNWAFFGYNEALKKIFHQIKFNNKKYLLTAFEPIFDSFDFSFFPDGFDCLVPVPLDRNKAWERGFNQSKVLASFLHRRTGIPIQEILIKSKITSTQSLLTRQARLQNLKGCYKVRSSRDLSGKRILLVDDIYTTGATVNECAQVLKQHGAASVCALTVARAGAEWN